jgi:hypothetical protein
MGPSRIEELLGRDHERLDGLLRVAVAGEAVGAAAYDAFRAGLLWHIGIEEKILIPFVRRRLTGPALATARQLKLDHAALTALLVPTPTSEIAERLQAVLAQHNPLEEGEDGFYAVCGQLAAADEDALLGRIVGAPPVPLAAHHDGPRAFANITRVLHAAGRIPGVS